MKRIILTALLAAAPMATTAQAADVCDTFATLGRKVMEKRQEGVSMGIVMRATVGTAERLFDSYDADRNPWASNMVIEAYKQPRYNNPELQASQIQDFEDRVSVECYQGTMQ